MAECRNFFKKIIYYNEIIAGGCPYHGWDYEDQDNLPHPDEGETHGTHIAGIIGAVASNNVGISGVAHDVQLMAFRQV